MISSGVEIGVNCGKFAGTQYSVCSLKLCVTVRGVWLSQTSRLFGSVLRLSIALNKLRLCMPLPIARRYASPAGLPLRWCGPLLLADVWPAVRQAGDVVGAATERAAAIIRAAEEEAAETLSKARLQAQLCAMQASLAAQRDVWQGPLQAWLDFVARLHAQRAEASDFALDAIKLVVGRLKLDTTVEQQLMSSVSLLLEHHVHSNGGEIRASVVDAAALTAALSACGRFDVVVVPDPDMPSGSCVLRCGELSFETSFDDNVQMVSDALDQLASGGSTSDFLGDRL